MCVQRAYAEPELCNKEQTSSFDSHGWVRPNGLIIVYE